MSNQELFDKAFKKYGGRFDLKLLSPYPYMTDFLNETRLAIKIVKEHHPALPEIYIDFIDNLSLNAGAMVIDGKGFIGINIGTYFLLLDFFNKVFAKKGLLESFGDSLQESEDEIDLSIRLNSGTIIFDPTVKEKVPNDPSRQFWASFCHTLSMHFLVYHELGHILRGHCGLIGSLNGNEPILEALSNKELQKLRYNGIDALFMQTCEMDADSFATNRSFNMFGMFMQNSGQDHPIKTSVPNWDSFITIWTFAIYVLHRFYGFDNPAETNYREGTHPPPTQRLIMIMGNIHSIFEGRFSREQVNRDFPTVLKGFELANQCFSASNFFSNGLGSIYETTKNIELFNNREELFKNWNNVKPRVQPFSFDSDHPPYVT